MEDRRILILAHDPLARAGLVTLLTGQGWAIVGGLAPGPDLAADLDLYRPDALLWDAGWDLDPEALSDLLAQLAVLPDAPPVVMLIPDADVVPDLWDVGVHALLPRDADAGRIAAALEAALLGLAVLDALFATALGHAGGQPVPAGAERPLEALTPRELEVLQQVAEGRSNREIALRLNISVHTVKFHVNAILAKLNAASRTEAVVRATRLGLILL
jgi:DNA-binding NarL/FixJ family response regulator